MSNGLLLWVDDEIELLKAHILFLEKKGYEIETVSNGQDAIDKCGKTTYDLILLDENMPGLSGLETLARIKEISPITPVVMVTKSEEENIMDQAIGFPLDIKIRCHGEYSYRITNPMLFYTNVCANVEDHFTRDEIDGQLKSELLTALQPAMFKISQNNIYYGAIPAYTMQLADELNELLSSKWRDRRGVEIVEFGVSSVKSISLLSP